MSFNWEEYIDFATQLKEKQAIKVSDEAINRIAISRAYYGAHCLARNHLKKIDYDLPEDGTAHAKVIQFFKTLGKRKEIRELANCNKTIGINLERLFDWRKQVDYCNDIKNIEKNTNIAMKWAKDIVDNLKLI